MQNMKCILTNMTCVGRHTKSGSGKYQGSFCSFLAMAMACTWYGVPSSSKRMLAFQPFGVPAVYNVIPVLEDMLPALELVLIAVPGKRFNKTRDLQRGELELINIVSCQAWAVENHQLLQLTANEALDAATTAVQSQT